MLSLLYLDQLVRRRRVASGQPVFGPYLAFLFAPLLSWAIVFGGARLLPQQDGADACAAPSPAAPTSLQTFTACFNQLADQQALPFALHPHVRPHGDDDASFTALLDDDLQVTGQLSHQQLAQLVVLASPPANHHSAAFQHAALVDALTAGMHGPSAQEVSGLVDQLAEEDQRDLQSGKRPVAQRSDCGFQLSLSMLDGYTQIYALEQAPDAGSGPASCRHSLH